MLNPTKFILQIKPEDVLAVEETDERPIVGRCHCFTFVLFLG